MYFKPIYVSFCSPQSQARLMFVTTLGMNNFDWTKMKAHLYHSLFMGGSHSQVEESITSPTSLPYLAKQLTALFLTQPLFSSFGYCSVVPMIYCIFKLKPSPALEAPGHSHQLIRLVNKYSLGHCGLSAASRHKPYSNWHYSTLLNSFFFFLEHNRIPSGKKRVTGVQAVSASKVQSIKCRWQAILSCP